MENIWNEAKNNTNLRTMFVKEIPSELLVATRPAGFRPSIYPSPGYRPGGYRSGGGNWRRW